MPASSLTDCAAIVLAGGQSRRMGRPKAWLEFEGVPLLAHLVERLAGTFPRVVVVGAPGQPLPETAARRVDDERPGEGPLGGIVTGLRALGDEATFAFVCSCDAPFLAVDVAVYLAHVCRCYDVAVPRWEGRLHPLHAVYRVAVLPVLETLFAAGERRPVALFDHVRTVIVPEQELHPLDPAGRTFWNMNTPDDYAAALAEWSRVRD